LVIFTGVEKDKLPLSFLISARKISVSGIWAKTEATDKRQNRNK
jgi:hypothetical protein